MTDASFEKDQENNQEYEHVGVPTVNILGDTSSDSERARRFADSLASMHIDEESEGKGFFYELSKAQIDVLQALKSLMIVIIWALYCL